MPLYNIRQDRLNRCTSARHKVPRTVHRKVGRGVPAEPPGFTRISIAIALALLHLCSLTAYASIQDGMGTNHVGLLSAQSIILGGETRTQWPARIVTAGGGPWNFQEKGENTIFWTPMIVATGTIQNVYVQTDSGTANVRIVRSHWQDDWETYTEIAAFQADDDGTTHNTWTSNVVTNGHRLGIAVTSSTNSTNLWWSIEYTQ